MSLTYKDFFEKSSENIVYSMKLPKELTRFIRYKAFMESEESDSKVTQTEVIKKGLYLAYKDDIEEYLEIRNKSKDKSKKSNKNKSKKD